MPCCVRASGGRRRRVSEQRFDAGIVGAVPQHGVEFAVEQHRHDLLARRRAFRVVDKFRDMGVLEGDPVHACEIESVVVLEHSAQPCAGRRGE